MLGSRKVTTRRQLGRLMLSFNQWRYAHFYVPSDGCSLAMQVNIDLLSGDGAINIVKPKKLKLFDQGGAESGDHRMPSMNQTMTLTEGVYVDSRAHSPLPRAQYYMLNTRKASFS